MTKLTEPVIEDFAIEQFKQLGCQYVYGCNLGLPKESKTMDETGRNNEL